MMHLLLYSSLLSLLSTAASAFAARRPAAQHIVIVGKIILDKYGPPDNNSQNNANDISIGVRIGGGGPQAAWGAAAALEAREYLLRAAEMKSRKKIHVHDEDHNRNSIKHQITFLAPVGMRNWTPSLSEQLSQLLPPMVKMVLIPSADHITPTINIWHDENENVRWMPVDGSFDNVGADGLWQNRPSAQDILNAIPVKDTDDGNSNDIILHAIIESGFKPTGKGLDALPFFDNELMSRVSSAGIEPIVFADDVTGKVTCEDSLAVTTTINKIRQSFVCARAYHDEENHGKSLFVVTPDRPCYEGMISHTNFTMSKGNIENIVRDGGNGCFTNEMKMPAATLRTISPVNPTGAGNAFSAAYVVCRGTGSSSKEAASIATAVGATICEYQHMPPWSSEVIERIVEGACEVTEKCKPSTSII